MIRCIFFCLFIMFVAELDAMNPSGQKSGYSAEPPGSMSARREKRKSQLVDLASGLKSWSQVADEDEEALSSLRNFVGINDLLLIAVKRPVVDEKEEDKTLKTIDNILKQAIETLDIERPDGEGNTLLHHAQTPAIVKLLVSYGAQPNPKNFCERTPLHIACSQNNIPVAETLISVGAQLDVLDNKKLCPLDHAKTEEMMKLVFEKGGGAESAPRFGEKRDTLLHRAQSSTLAKILIEGGIPVDSVNAEGQTPLFTCNSPELIKFYLAKGAQVNYKDFDKRTPFAFYAERLFDVYRQNKQKEKERLASCLKVLIQHGAQADYKDKNRQTLLFATRDYSLAEAILWQKCNHPNFQDLINLKNLQGQTAFFAQLQAYATASNEEKPQILKYLKTLIAFGAKIDHKDKNGQTFLFTTRDYALVRALLWQKYGLGNSQDFVNIRNNQGKTAFSVHAHDYTVASPGREKLEILKYLEVLLDYGVQRLSSKSKEEELSMTAPSGNLAIEPDRKEIEPKEVIPEEFDTDELDPEDNEAYKQLEACMEALEKSVVPVETDGLQEKEPLEKDNPEKDEKYKELIDFNIIKEKAVLDKVILYKEYKVLCEDLEDVLEYSIENDITMLKEPEVLRAIRRYIEVVRKLFPRDEKRLEVVNHLETFMEGATHWDLAQLKEKASFLKDTVVFDITQYYKNTSESLEESESNRPSSERGSSISSSSESQGSRVSASTESGEDTLSPASQFSKQAGKKKRKGLPVRRLLSSFLKL